MGQEVQTMERAEDGRLTGARGLTEQQRALVVAFAIEGTVAGAARVVGCGAVVASNTLRLAHVQAALRGECRSMLARAAPVAIAALLSIVEDETLIKTRLGLDASKAILDRVGFMPQKPGEGRDGDKRDLSDLSIAELEAFIRQGQERQRQAGAVDTEGTITVGPRFPGTTLTTFRETTLGAPQESAQAQASSRSP